MGYTQSKSSVELLVEDAGKNLYGNFAIEIFIGQTKEADKYFEEFKNILESTAIITDLVWGEYKGAFVAVFNKSTSNQRPWQRITKSFENCFKHLDKDVFIRIRIYKDVHFYDNAYMQSNCVLDEFVSWNNPMRVNLLGSILANY